MNSKIFSMPRKKKKVATKTTFHIYDLCIGIAHEYSAADMKRRIHCVFCCGQLSARWRHPVGIEQKEHFNNPLMVGVN